MNIFNIKITSILFVFLIINFLIPLHLLASDGNNEASSLESTSNNQSEGADVINPQDPSVLKGYVSKVPRGTKLKIIIETPIDEEINKIDDEVTARTSEDIIIDGNIVVGAGSTVIGTISEINLARRFHKAGSIRIEFKNLTTPDGRQIPIVASVLTHSGLLKGKYTKKTALISTATIAAPIAAGLGAGLATEGSAVGAGVGATLGALAGLVLFFFQRGNMVDIKAGDELNIELTEEALIPKVVNNDLNEVEKSPPANEEKSDETNLLETDFTEPAN